MKMLRILRDRLRALVRPDQVHDDIADEFRFHVEMRARENVQRGMSAAEAQRDAERRFGHVAHIRDLAYDVRGGGWAERLWQDVRYGARMLAAHKVFTATVILTLGIGVGASTTVFTLVDRLLLRTLPVARPAELERLSLADDETAFSVPFYRELRRRNDVFSGLIARQRQTATISHGGDARRGLIELVSGNYFSVLGTLPSHGRLLNDADDRVSLGAPVAVLSHRYWRDHLSGDPDVVGKTMHIDSHPFTVVGVAAPEFFGVEVGAIPDAWVPISMQPQVFALGATLADDEDWRWLDLIGRRAPTVTRERAQAGATIVLRQIQATSRHALPDDAPQSMRTIKLIAASRGLSPLRDEYDASLRILMGVVALVVLTACASITTLVVTRSTSRRREIAVRLALGGTRVRLVRQLLTEGMLLSLCGGVAGVLFAHWGLGALLRFLPAASVPIALDTSLDARSLGFSLAVAMLAALVFSAGPALRSTRLNLVDAIRTGSDSPIVGRDRISVRMVLVTVQVALSLVLVIGASVFTRSLAAVAAIPIGLQTDNVVLASIDPSLSGYTPARVTVFYRELGVRLKTINGVRAVGFAAVPLLGGAYNIRTVMVPGRPDPAKGRTLFTNTVGGDFFGATGLQLRRGRGFGPQDSAGAPPVIVLNEAAAHDYFGDEDAVGRTVRMDRPVPVQIIGVVSDSKYRSVREEIPRIVYSPSEQDLSAGWGSQRTIYVRTTGDASRFKGVVEATVRSIDRTLPLYNIKTFSAQKAESLLRERLMAALSSFSGAVTLAMAAIALYGLITFGAVTRTREIGIRMSLGADRPRVIWLVLRSAIGMVLCGCIGGVGLGVLLSRFVRAQLYGVSPTDLTTMEVAIGVLICTALAAALVPALRAARVDPTVALRYE